MSRPFLGGPVADICLDLVATPSVYGEEGALADLIERRVAELDVEHERIGDSIVARTGSAARPSRWSGTSTPSRTGPTGRSSARPTASSAGAPRT